jgi:hypothetical protein
MESVRRDDRKGFVLESMWLYLLFTELANELCREYEAAGLETLTREEYEFLEYCNTHHVRVREPFTLRLESCVNALNARVDALNDAMSETADKAVSEGLHSSFLADIERRVRRSLSGRRRAFVLIDNLDKSWDKSADITKLTPVLLALFGVVNNFVRRCRRGPKDEGGFAGALAIFIRADIFDRVIKDAREPDKIAHHRMKWDDPELLLRLVEERYQASRLGNKPNEMWDKYFCKTIIDLCAMKDI